MDTLEQTTMNEVDVALPATEATEPTQQSVEQTKNESTSPLMKTKEEVLARAQELAKSCEAVEKQEIELIKTLYYRYHNAQVTEHREQYLSNGGDPTTYLPPIDPTEEPFKQAMQTIRQHRTDAMLAQEKERQENLRQKQEIIEKIKELATTPEEASTSYESFRQLQTQWKEIGTIPQDAATETYKNYQLYVEQFYDMLKLNSEMREYDFRKNLEAKTILCEQAEKLSQEQDVVNAINTLQRLHQEWKEIGPVSKEKREEIWARFKDASTIVRKRHQEYFEARKAQEEENLQKKTALCEQVEHIETATLNTFNQWEEKTKEIIALQATWKNIGFAPQKQNNQIFERFRAACDLFFMQKTKFFQNVKENLDENLKKKIALCEQAEAIKASTEWKKTTEAMIELQKQWKAIGAVPRKSSDQIWQRFTTACNTFFEAKKQAHAGQRTEQKNNLKAKKDLIDQLKNLLEEAQETAVQQVRQIQQQWNEIGHVPIHEKDKLYEQYHTIVDEIYKKHNLSQVQRRLSSFRNALKVTAEKDGNNSLSRERERLSRAYEMMKNEIQTYENNLCFLSVGSKKGNSLVQEIQRKVEKLKAELELLKQKISAVNEEMHKE